MSLQIILAEDEALVSLSLADWLEAEGHRVVQATDGVEALEAARGLDALDLLVTDLRMPNLDGEGLIRTLWADRPGVPVLVVTGSAPRGGTDALRPEVGYGGPLALLHKPLDYRAFGEALHRITGPASAHSL